MSPGASTSDTGRPAELTDSRRTTALGSAPAMTTSEGLTPRGPLAGTPQPPSRQAMRVPATATGAALRPVSQKPTSRSGPSAGPIITRPGETRSLPDSLRAMAIACSEDASAIWSSSPRSAVRNTTWAGEPATIRSTSRPRVGWRATFSALALNDRARTSPSTAVVTGAATA